jgi:signal transduction histidine kinase
MDPSAAGRYRGMSKPLRVVLALLAAAPVMAVVVGLQRYFLQRSRGGPLNWGDFFGAHVAFWLAWMIIGGAVAPAALHIIRRWPRPSARVALLATIGLVAVAAHPALDIAFRSLGLPPGFDTPPDFQTYAVFFFGPLAHNVLVYAAIVGLTYAMWYHEHFLDRELAAAQLGAQLTQARLDALRAQLNPHFLFNAMNSIAMLVRGNGNAQAVRMLAGLSDLLRWALDDGLPKEIPLSKEMEFIDRYLSIEQVRFQNRLRVDAAIDDRALPVLVPTLLLQPLVENAIRHGIGKRKSASEVKIDAHVDGGTLTIEVRDDGPGPSRFVDGLRGNGVGLRNTEARLAAAYGDAWSLELEARPEGGTIARVRLPAHVALPNQPERSNSASF